MGNDDKIINKTLLDRIFAQLDTNTENISELTRISGEHSSAISILKKIFISIFLFIVISFSATFFIITDTTIKDFVKNEKQETISGQQRGENKNGNTSNEVSIQ